MPHLTPENVRTSSSAHPAPTWTLALESVSVQRGRRTVLHDVTLALHPGQCVAVIGPNGAGKTTLLLALLGVIRPSQGAVRLDGVDFARLSARARGRFCSYLPQTVERLPGFSVHELATASRHPHVRPLRPLSAHDRAAVENALRICGLTTLAHRPVNALSGGERKKALLAAAFAQEPRLLVLDEPNAALDPPYQIELAALLRDWLAADRTRSIVLVSHDLQLPAVLEARVVALRAGRLIADGPAATLLSPERLEAVFAAQFQSVRDEQGRALVVPRWGESARP